MRLILFLLILISKSTFALECSEDIDYKNFVKSQYSRASSIILGKVEKSQCSDVECGYINNDIRVHKTLKGKEIKTINLASIKSWPTFYAGYDYIIFLFGNNEIDPCGLVLEVGYNTRTSSDLEELADREDLDVSARLRELLPLLVQP